MKKIQIIGAGLAGLLAAYHLSKENEVLVLEKKKDITENHSAILRFNSDISGFCPIPLEKATVYKNIFYKGDLYNTSNTRFNNLYSLKTTGKLEIRSISNLDEGVRYIPSQNYFKQLLNLCIERGVKFSTGREVTKDDLLRKDINTVITVPLPFILNILGFQCNPFDFSSKEIKTWSISLPDSLSANVHQTVYFPDRADLAYRISIVGNRIVVEIPESKLNSDTYVTGMVNQIKEQIGNAFGIYHLEGNGNWHTQKFGKLVAINEELRKELIYNITQKTGCYLLGRFATWRQIMIPEVVNDIIKIEKWIKMLNLSGYDYQKQIGG